MNEMNTKISAIGVVPVIKLNNPERDAAPLAKALCEGGVPVAEVTFRAAGADTAIKLMKEACPDMLVGAGTVLTKEQCDRAIAAGANVIMPNLSPESARAKYELYNGKLATGSEAAENLINIKTNTLSVTIIPKIPKFKKKQTKLAPVTKTSNAITAKIAVFCFRN